MSKKKEVQKVGALTENKKNIIAALIDEYGIETADDIQEALRDLLGGTIKSMMESEMTEHLGYDNYERSDGSNYRNGTCRRRSVVITANSKSTFHRIAIVRLNLKSLKNVRRIFLKSTRKSSVCMPED